MGVQKHSKKRDAILACLQGTKTHPTADWVYAALKPTIRDLSLGTVYRNLAAFKQDGTIQSVGVVDGNERFDADTSPHAHFVCTVCGTVTDLPDVPIPATSLAADCGRVNACSLTFSGVCRACEEAQS